MATSHIELRLVVPGRSVTASQLVAHSDGEKVCDLSLPVVDVHRGGVEVVERLADEWRELCEEALDDQPFYRPEWVGAYLRTFAPRKTVLLITARVSGRLKAALPLVEEQTRLWGFPVKRIRSAANVHCLRFDLLRSARPEGQVAARAIWEYLRDSVEWDLLEMHYVPAGGTLEELALAAQANGFQTERQESWQAPYISLRGGNGSEESCLRETQAKFRANLRRRWRNLSAQGPLVLRRFDKADPHVLQRFFDLERSGWKGHTGSAIALDPERQRFYEEIARVAGQFGYLALYVHESNARDVAAQFGLSYRGCYFLLKPAYDESYRQCSPGHLLVHAVLGDCVKRGYHEFDFLGACDDWKREWTSKVRIHNVWWVFSKTWRGRALHGVMFATRCTQERLLNWSSSARNAIQALVGVANPDGKD